MSRSRALALLPLVAALAPLAAANLTNPVTPPFRGAPCTHFAGWEVFTQPSASPNAPDVAGTTATSASLTQLVPGAILTSTGNIYHPGAATQFELDDAVANDLQELVVQLSTFGNALDLASIALAYVDAQSQTVVLAPVELTYLVQTAGHEEVYARWDLSAVLDAVGAYTVRFQAAATSMSLDAVLLDARDACTAAAGFCFGDGSSTQCPCGNNGAAGRGCASSAFAAGALLSASGTASVSADSVSLAASSMTGSVAIFFQGATQTPPAVIDDGIGCVGGPIIRLGNKPLAANASSYPQGGDPLVSVRGAIPPAGGTYAYQCFYRNAAAAFCPPATSNRTNGVQITWLP